MATRAKRGGNGRTKTEDMTNQPIELKFGGRLYKVKSPPVGVQLAWGEKISDLYDRGEEQIAAAKKSKNNVKASAAMRETTAFMREKVELVFEYMQLGEKQREEILKIASNKDFDDAIQKFSSDVFR